MKEKILGFKKKKGSQSLFIQKITHDGTDIPVSCVHLISHLLTPLGLLQTQVHDYLIVPLPAHFMVRLISFIRVIRGLGSSQ